MAAEPVVVRWEDVSIRVFIDDVEGKKLAASDFNADPDVTFETVKYAGDSVSTKDATFRGWSGSCTFQLPSGAGDPLKAFIKYLDGVVGRTNTGRTRWLVGYKSEGGSRASLALENVQWKAGLRSGDGQRLDFPVTFEAEDGQVAS